MTTQNDRAFLMAQIAEIEEMLKLAQGHPIMYPSLLSRKARFEQKLKAAPADLPVAESVPPQETNEKMVLQGTLTGLRLGFAEFDFRHETTNSRRLISGNIDESLGEDTVIPFFGRPCKVVIQKAFGVFRNSPPKERYLLLEIREPELPT